MRSHKNAGRGRSSRARSESACSTEIRETHKGLHDYEGVLRNGHTIALEVTSAADPTKISLLKKLEADGRALGPAAFSRSWQITISWDANVNRLRKKADQIALALGACEIFGIHSFSARHSGRLGDASPVQSVLLTFPEIEHAYSWTPKGEPKIELIWGALAGFTGSEVVNPFVEEFVASAEGDRLS